MAETIATLERRIEIIEKEQEKQSKTIYGNGDIGMGEMLRQVLAYVNEQKARQATNWTDTKKFVIGALAFIVNTLLAIGISEWWDKLAK